LCNALVDDADEREMIVKSSFSATRFV